MFLLNSILVTLSPMLSMAELYSTTSSKPNQLTHFHVPWLCGSMEVTDYLSCSIYSLCMAAIYICLYYIWHFMFLLCLVLFEINDARPRLFFAWYWRIHGTRSLPTREQWKSCQEWIFMELGYVNMFWFVHYIYSKSFILWGKVVC